MNPPSVNLPPRGWVLYDGECPLCQSAVRRFQNILIRNGFHPDTLQAAWVSPRLGLPRDELLREMLVLTREGTVFGGADAIIHLAGYVWWAKPLAWLGRLPLFRLLLAALYRRVAEHRRCTITACRLIHTRHHHGTSAFLTMP